MTANVERLFVYGSLAPGRPNEHIMHGIDGKWEQAFVYGFLHNSGWGAAMGFPGIELHEKGGKVPGFLFTSSDLWQHWARLDAFEGAEYQRVKTPVFLLPQEQEVSAFLYVLIGQR